MQPLILLIDNEPPVRRTLTPVFEAAGWKLLHAEDGHQGQAMALEHRPHLVLLDLLLPRLDGLSLCQRLRRDHRTAATPILVLTALDSIADKVKAFENGADDYVVKPFDGEEVFVRARSLLRYRLEAPAVAVSPRLLHYGPLTLQPDRHDALWCGQPVGLTQREYDLLHCLLQRHGQAVSCGVILQDVWGYPPDSDIECIRTHIRHLRTKIELDSHRPAFLKTIYGVGYCLDLPSLPANADQPLRPAPAVHLVEQPVLRALA